MDRNCSLPHCGPIHPNYAEELKPLPTLWGAMHACRLLKVQAMNAKRTLLVAGLLTLSSAVAGSAHAQCAAYGGGYGGFGFGAWDVGRLYRVLADNVPYHAAFPPVYYSYPVPRTYGYSPFAYPPGVMTPEVELQPQVIDNPYVAPGIEEGPEAVQPQVEPSNDSTTSTARESQPLVIYNPYVTDAKLAAGR